MKSLNAGCPHVVGSRRHDDCDRHAEERPALAALKRRVRCSRSFTRAGEIAHWHGVEITVERLDRGDELIGQFKRGDLLLQQRLCEFAALR